MIFYTGSYTEKDGPAAHPSGKGIGCFDFNNKTGAIKLLGYTKQRNPSYVVISDDKKHLYACEELFERQNPKVHSYKIGENGALQLINCQALKGDFACHLALFQDILVVSNYVSGNVLSFPVSGNGELAPYTQLIQHEGTGPNKKRQETAHAHMVYPFGKNSMYVADLGIDTVKAYRLSDTGKWDAVHEMDIHIEAGAGPRHMLLDRDKSIAYILGELSSEIFVLQQFDNSYIQVQKRSCLPKGFNGTHGAAALRIHPGKKFIYASVRGADLIAIFKIEEKTGFLEIVEFQPTMGKSPRDFNIHPDGQWLIAANQDSDQMIVYEIDRETGMLSKKSVFEVETPVNITWLY